MHIVEVTPCIPTSVVVQIVHQVTGLIKRYIVILIHNIITGQNGLNKAFHKQPILTVIQAAHHYKHTETFKRLCEYFDLFINVNFAGVFQCCSEIFVQQLYTNLTLDNIAMIFGPFCIIHKILIIKMFEIDPSS